MSKSTLGSILLVLLFFSVSGQEPIELIFTTQNNSEYVPFDTVYIENMTQDCDTALIYPDTVLSLDIPTGIFEKAIETSGFELTQTGPNPMAGHTNFTVTLSDKAEVYFAVSDLNGRNFFNQRKMMNSGIHSFRFFPGNNNFYILSVQVDQFSKSLKMLNDTRYSYPSSTCVLEYLGRKDHVKRFKSSFNKNDFVFNQGDLLIYTVHSDSGERKISDRPLENQTYTFHYSGTPCPGMSYVWDVDTKV